MNRLNIAALLLMVHGTIAAPVWSWDVVPNYFHCANTSGEWNDQTLKMMATKPFVGASRCHFACFLVVNCK
jgi:hypothetical protein